MKLGLPEVLDPAPDTPPPIEVLLEWKLEEFSISLKVMLFALSWLCSLSALDVIAPPCRSTLSALM